MAHLRSRHIWWLVIPVLAVALLGAGRYYAMASRAMDQSDPTRARGKQLPVPVRTTRVTSGPVTTVVGATAVAVASEKVMIRIGPSRRVAEYNPVLCAVRVHDGSRVKAGQVLFELDPSEFELAVTQKREAEEAALAQLARSNAGVTENAKVRVSELENAAEEVRARTADVAYRKEDADRNERLYQRQNASLHERLETASAYVEALADLTEARVREDRAKAEMVVGPLKDRQAVESAENAVQLAKLRLALAENDLAGCKIRSPIEGYVDKVRVAKGQKIDMLTSLALVLKVDPIHVKLDFPQERIDALAVGQSAEVVFDTFPQETFQAKVVRIPVQVDTQNRAIPAIVELANPGHRIRPGVSAYARVHVSRRTTTAPAVSVIRLDTNAMAFVVQEGRARIRKVRTGPVVETGVVEVVEGLKEGDEVVIYGQQHLRENDRVNTNWREWSRRE